MSQSVDVSIEYFAQFRELAGVSTERIATAATDAASLYQELASGHGFELPQSDVKVAVNDEFVDWAYQLKTGDTVVFIPPVAGG